MASWSTQRKKARQRDGYQCQICGDFPGCPYANIHVHHIRPRAEGGTNDLKNLICLCDHCHSVCHPHLGPAFCGLPKFPLERQDEIKQDLDRIRQEFLDFIYLPFTERNAIQQKLWKMWEIQDRKSVS